MIVKIAWKNIWRNKLRSSVVILSIVLGLWAGAFIFAYVFGIMEQRLKVAIGYEISHFQLHHPEYNIDNEAKFTIAKSNQIYNQLSNTEEVVAYSNRIIAYGMVNSPKVSMGGKFIGINPEDESRVTKLDQFITEGDYLNVKDRNKIIIGKRLADKLKVKKGSKIVLSFQDLNQDIVAGAFRIKGIFESVNSTIEGSNLYLLNSELGELMSIGTNSHEIAVLLADESKLEQVTSSLRKEDHGLLLESWKEISPELGLMIDSIDQYMVIFLIIILLALSFGIINTMLMAVLERVKEIGVLMSIGMNKSKLFFLIFYETVFIVAIAAPIGLLLAYITITYLGTHGLDISGMQKDAYAAFGIESIVYPKLAWPYYLRIFIMVSITALLASLYPAYTAIRLDPVKAIRKI